MSQSSTSDGAVVREDVAGGCPRCGEERLQRYAVVGEEGWVTVVKCQACLLSVERERGNRLGPITLLVDQL
jgi:transcription elongation factor Elf1